MKGRPKWTCVCCFRIGDDIYLYGINEFLWYKINLDPAEPLLVESNFTFVRGDQVKEAYEKASVDGTNKFKWVMARVE